MLVLVSSCNRPKPRRKELGLEDCRECGKPVSTEAKTCPNCGAGKPAKTTSKTRWGAVFLTVLAIGGLARVMGNHPGVDPGDSRPECRVKMANGVLAQRSCDLVNLCADRIKATHEYFEIQRRYKETDRLDEKLDAHELKIQGLNAQLKNYAQEDLKKVCNMDAAYFEPLGAQKITPPMTPSKASMNDGSCRESPLVTFPFGTQIKSSELVNIIDRVCPGASFLTDKTVRVKWEGKQYQIMSRKLLFDGAEAQYEITSIKTTD
jgi:ribosomal protein L37E